LGKICIWEKYIHIIFYHKYTFGKILFGKIYILTQQIENVKNMNEISQILYIVIFHNNIFIKLNTLQHEKIFGFSGSKWGGGV